MKKIKMKYALITATLLCNAGLAMAHDLSGSLAAGTPTARSKVDLYQVTCGAGSAKLEAQVRDPSADSSLVSVQVKKAFVVASSQDLNQGDAGYGSMLTVNAGSGVYEMFVNRSSLLAQNYGVSYHCKSATGEHTGTSYVTRQNQ